MPLLEPLTWPLHAPFVTKVTTAMALILLKLNVQEDTSAQQELNLQPNTHVQPVPTVMMELGAVMSHVDLVIAANHAQMASTVHWEPRILTNAHQAKNAHQAMD